MRCVLSSKQSVTVVRKGKPKQIDRQVHSYCLKRKRQRRKLKTQRHFVERILDRFDGDATRASQWLEETQVAPYGISAGEMLRRGNFKALKRFVERTLLIDEAM